MIFKDNIVGLVVFCFGGGSKLLQSQLDGSKQLLSIPAYPLKYYYPHWNEWKKKYSNLNAKLVLKLINRHHASILDSRLIPGNNGLRNLGVKKNKHINISKIKFNNFFLQYLKAKKINSKNVLMAIHFAYFKSKKINLKKMTNILYHIHEADYFNKYLLQDFKNSKLIVCCRDPINYFWKKIRLDHKIEEDRFNKTERIYLRQFDYLNSLDSMFIGFKNIPNKFFNKYHVIKFEDLKKNNISTLKKLSKYLNIKISKKLTKPTFDGLAWWCDKSYEKEDKFLFDNIVYDYSEDKRLFFSYEIFLLQYILKDFFKKTQYKSLVLKASFIKDVIFFILIFLPTKQGFHNLVFFLNPLNSIIYIKDAFVESFFKKRLKNYYFNAMYRHKKQYAERFFIKLNYFRKFIFEKENKKNYFLFVYVNRILNFLFKIFFYTAIPLNLILLYFKRICFLIFYYFKIKNALR